MGKRIRPQLLESAAFDKLVHDLIDHAGYFDGRWLERPVLKEGEG